MQRLKSNTFQIDLDKELLRNEESSIKTPENSSLPQNLTIGITQNDRAENMKIEEESSIDNGPINLELSKSLNTKYEDESPMKQLNLSINNEDHKENLNQN